MIPSRHKCLADYLAERSMEICTDWNCDEENHNCHSYAYITRTGELMGIAGATAQYIPLVVIPLPFLGTQAELEAEITQQVNDWTI